MGEESGRVIKMERMEKKEKGRKLVIWVFF